MLYFKQLIFEYWKMLEHAVAIFLFSVTYVFQADIDFFITTVWNFRTYKKVWLCCSHVGIS